MAGQGTKAAVALTGAVSGALLSAACCLGPLVLALLGLGGAGMALALEPYRPWFLTGTVLLLGAGFYHTYRQQGQECGEGQSCQLPRSHQLGRILLWIATIVVIATATFPEYSIYLF